MHPFQLSQQHALSRLHNVALHPSIAATSLQAQHCLQSFNADATCGSGKQYHSRVLSELLLAA